MTTVIFVGFFSGAVIALATGNSIQNWRFWAMLGVVVLNRVSQAFWEPRSLKVNWRGN